MFITRTPIVIAAAGLLAVATPAPAGLLVDEPFAGYNPGTLNGQAANGLGLTGDYTAATDGLDVVGDTIVYNRPDDFNAPRVASAKTLGSPAFDNFLATNGTVFYARLDVRIDTESGTGAGSATGGDAFASLVWDAQAVGDGDNLQFGLIDGQFAVAGAGSTSASGGAYAVGTDYALVIRVAYNPGGNSTSENIKMWVNPTSESDPTVIDDDGGYLFNSFTRLDDIAIQGEDLEGNLATFDLVQVGESFADVMIPEPASLALLSLGSALVLIGRRRTA